MTDHEIETVYRNNLSNSLTAALRAVFDAGVESTKSQKAKLPSKEAGTMYDGQGKSTKTTASSSVATKPVLAKVKAAGGDTRSFAERMKTKK